MLVCNMCGKEDKMYSGVSHVVDGKIRRDSQYAGEYFDLDLCCECFDKVVDWIIPQCKHNPITDM